MSFLRRIRPITRITALAAGTTRSMGGNNMGTSGAFSAGGYIGATAGGVGGTSLGAVGGSDLIPSTSHTTSYGTSWDDFCTRHARVAAADFAKACISFINEHLIPDETRNIPPQNFAQKFVEAFADEFEIEFFRRRNTSKVRFVLSNH